MNKLNYKIKSMVDDRTKHLRRVETLKNQLHAELAAIKFLDTFIYSLGYELKTTPAGTSWSPRAPKTQEAACEAVDVRA